METHENTVFWKGTHISNFQTSLNFLQYPEVVNNDNHVVLIQTPWKVGKVPDSFPSIFDKIDYWDQNHVKLPCSEKNITENEISRWNLIREALNSVILSGQQLESAILSYNKRYAEKWNLATLKIFFDEVCCPEESSIFFQSLLPKIVDLALCLPELITGGIPLLKHGHTRSITLSQLQIASLLANAFFCTFPNRNTSAKGTEYANYPTINFTRLFQAVFRDRKKATHEKIRCLLHYFRRVTTNAPSGVVTYSRHFVHNLLIPQWCQSTKTLPRLYVSSKGFIEDEGFGLYQMDFAHKLVGGGVIANGCVQEEIRFIICPELILSRLFTECLDDNEALIVTGCERFSKYKGYGKSFSWDGDYVDETPCDEEGRKYCTVVAIDALFFKRNPKEQYSPAKMNRELNKAYAGFSWGSRTPRNKLCGIASGNWGCGVYRGNAEFKSLLQMMAAAESGRDLAYFTFGNDELRDSMNSIHEFLINNNVAVGKIYNLLLDYNVKQLYDSITVYDFLKKKALEESAVPQKASENANVTSQIIKPFGIPKLAVTKRSFCYRRKTTDEENKSITEPDLSVETDCIEESKQLSKEDDAGTKYFKQKESEILLKMYNIPSNFVNESSGDSSDEPETKKRKEKPEKSDSEGEDVINSVVYNNNNKFENLENSVEGSSKQQPVTLSNLKINKKKFKRKVPTKLLISEKQKISHYFSSK